MRDRHSSPAADGRVESALPGRARHDRSIAQLALAQHGVVDDRDLDALGLTPKMIRGRVTRGHLHPRHTGVYAVGHARLTERGRWLAAVKACGPGAVLSHRAAAALHGVLPSSGLPEVTVGRALRPRPGLVLHRGVVPADEVTELDAIPVTGLARTLFDLAAVVRPQQLERAFREAQYQRLTDTITVGRLLTRHPRRPGAAALRRALAHADDGRLRSSSEADVLAFLDAHRLPRPLTNVQVEGFEVDAWWPRERVVAEFDGWQAHRTRAAFERDRRKSSGLQAAGIPVVAITERRLTDDAPALARDLRRLLAARVTAATDPG